MKKAYALGVQEDNNIMEVSNESNKNRWEKRSIRGFFEENDAAAN